MNAIPALDTRKLGPVKLAILKLLLEADGELVSCNAIRRRVYGKRSEIADSRDREAGLIRTQICLLNRKLEGTGARIVNRKGLGWFIVSMSDAKAST